MKYTFHINTFGYVTPFINELAVITFGFEILLNFFTGYFFYFFK